MRLVDTDAFDERVRAADGMSIEQEKMIVESLSSLYPLQEFEEKAIHTILDALPPIQPEIVRCKDCKHWIPYDWMFSEVWQSKNIADYPEDEIWCDCCDMAMKANDFCSRGEKREVTT